MIASLVITALVLFTASWWSRGSSTWPGFPVADADGENLKEKKRKFLSDSKNIIYNGLRQWKRPFQVLTPLGPKIILPNKFAHEIRNHPDLDFQDVIKDDFMGEHRGFDLFGLHPEVQSILISTVRVKLTQSLGNVTGDLCEETTTVLKERLGDSPEWKEIVAKPEMLYIVARAASRVFLGPVMCKNDEWIRLSIGYTMDVFNGAHELRHWPAFLRPIVNEVLPSCRNVRAKAAEARSLLEPEIRRRRENNEKLLAEGKPLPKLSDTITWFDEMAKGRPFDPTSMQLSLSAAAMHTTSDLLTNAIYDLCANPEYFEPLREEIMAVLKEDGWKKTSLYKMKLLDSFMKESQRHTPTTIAMMQRKARKAVTLSDGTVIPKGAIMAVATDFMMDPQVYPDPQKFDAYRFLKMRQHPGQENNWQFVSTSPEHMGFGHGIHACPGRFFASNETKILLCYMLIMYDWRFPEGQGRPKTWTHTLENTSDPTVKLLFRRREDDVPSWE